MFSPVIISEDSSFLLNPLYTSSTFYIHFQATIFALHDKQTHAFLFTLAPLMSTPTSSSISRRNFSFLRRVHSLHPRSTTWGETGQKEARWTWDVGADRVKLASVSQICMCFTVICLIANVAHTNTGLAAKVINRVVKTEAQLPSGVCFSW